MTIVICDPHLHYAGGAHGVLPCKGGVNDQSIGSIVSDSIVRSWLWSTATGSCQLGYFGSITACC